MIKNTNFFSNITWEQIKETITKSFVKSDIYKIDIKWSQIYLPHKAKTITYSWSIFDYYRLNGIADKKNINIVETVNNLLVIKKKKK